MTEDTPLAPTTSYLTNDTLGSPRVITDSSRNIESRRDFMPFGEEISAIGGMTSGLGYQSDAIRQKFTSYERDNESDLDFAQARMYQSRLGRFTTTDPLHSSANIQTPQSWNRYIYTYNNPLVQTDPFGLWVWGEGFGGNKNEADLTREERNKRKEFKDSLEQAQLVAALYSMSDDLTDQLRAMEINRAIESYGEEGVDNGVTLKIGNLDGRTAASVKLVDTNYVRETANGEIVPNIEVTFARRTTINAVTVTHEGSHIADNADFARVSLTDTTLSTQDWINSPLNSTKYRTESRAYRAGSYVAESLGINQNANGVEYWNTGWSAADKETNRANGINRILREQYGVERITREGRKLVEISQPR